MRRLRRRLARGLRVLATSMMALSIATAALWLAPAQTVPPVFAHASKPAVSPSPLPAASSVPVAAAQPQPHNTTVYGDLAHLTYTAVGPLTASFVFPNDGFASATMAVRFVLMTVRDAGVELAVDGQVIPASKIGKRVVVVKSGQTEYDYYGVVLRPGPNDVTITPLGLNGLRGPTQHATIYGPGPPATLHAQFAKPLVADGRTAQTLSVTALDRWGHPAQPGSTLRVAIVSGSARFQQAHTEIVTPEAQQLAPTPSPQPSDEPDSSQNNAAMPTDPARLYDGTLNVGGDLEVPVVPGDVAGDLRIRLIAQDVEETQSFFIAPYLRKAFVNGLISVGGGAVPIAVDGDGIADGGGARRARVALFAQGAVSKKASLTLAYESQNRLNPVSSYGPYTQDPNERPYLTYGDSSTISDDFESNTRVYARLDTGRSNVMWGQFNAEITDPSGLGSFHELLGGAKAEIASHDGNAKATIFTAHNTTAYVSQVVPASGLSTLAQPLRADIVVGSDYLTLVALDRRTGAIVSQTPLIRNVDYTIDYATGVLRFINVPLPFDDQFNPQSVLIQYTYQGPSTDSQTSGAQVDMDFGAQKQMRAQLGYVNDSGGAGNFALFSQALSGTISGGNWVVSHAFSSGGVPGQIDSTLGTGTGGQALAFAYNRRTGFDQLALTYDDTSAGFANPFGGLSVPGFSTYRAAWTHASANHDELNVELDGERNTGLGVDDDQRSETVSWRHELSSAASLQLGLTTHAQNAGNASLAGSATPAPGTIATNSVTQALAGVDVKLSSKVSLNAQRTMTIAGSDQDSTQPAQTTAQLNYDIDKRGRLFIRELMSDAPVASFAQASSDLTVGSMATRSTAIGIERLVGSGTTLSSEYLLSSTATGEDIYSALGVQQKLDISKHVAGNFFVQSANATGASTGGGFTVSGFSLGYVNSDRVRGGLAFQNRGGYGGGDTINGGLAGNLSPNVAAVAVVQQASAAGTTSAEDRFSLAYRPDQNDRFISLFSWDRFSGTGSVAVGSASNVLSFDEFWRPWHGGEIAGRAAYKLDGDGLYVAHTALAALRVRQAISKRADIGAEIRALALPGIAGTDATDLALEAGYNVGQGTRAAVGYSFKGGVDPTLTGTDAKKGFYFTITTLVDHLFGWGSGK